jgi:hypothetical protein
MIALEIAGIWAHKLTYCSSLEYNHQEKNGNGHGIRHESHAEHKQ